MRNRDGKDDRIERLRERIGQLDSAWAEAVGKWTRAAADLGDAQNRIAELEAEVERQRDKIECISAHDIVAQLAVVRDAVTKAVADEREACARIVLGYGESLRTYNNGDLSYIAATIRSRGGDQ